MTGEAWLLIAAGLAGGLLAAVVAYVVGRSDGWAACLRRGDREIEAAIERNKRAARRAIADLEARAAVESTAPFYPKEDWFS